MFIARTAHAILLLAVGVPCAAAAQDVLAADRLKGLAGLQVIRIVARANFVSQVITIGELGDHVEMRLRRDVPALAISQGDNADWLEIGAVTSINGGAVSLAVYRWVTLLGNTSPFFAIVWSDQRYIFGSVRRSDLTESLDALLTKFVVEYSRAVRE